MWRSILFIFLTVFVVSCSEPSNCSDFKTGEFSYVIKERPEKIIRTTSTQTEFNTETKTVVKSSVKWTSDCSYQLRYLDVLNYDKDISDIIGTIIYCEILETYGDTMKVRAKSERIDDILEFVKIK